VDGNKRLAWTACRTFLAINGQWISAPEDERFDFVIRVATGVVPDLDKIAEQRAIRRAEPLDSEVRCNRNVERQAQPPLRPQRPFECGHAVEIP
jgi:prophage maintenance system killer protein